MVADCDSPCTGSRFCACADAKMSRNFPILATGKRHGEAWNAERHHTMPMFFCARVDTKSEPASMDKAQPTLEFPPRSSSECRRDNLCVDADVGRKMSRFRHAHLARCRMIWARRGKPLPSPAAPCRGVRGEQHPLRDDPDNHGIRRCPFTQRLPRERTYGRLVGAHLNYARY